MSNVKGRISAMNSASAAVSAFIGLSYLSNPKLRPVTVGTLDDRKFANVT